MIGKGSQLIPSAILLLAFFPMPRPAWSAPCTVSTPSYSGQIFDLSGGGPSLLAANGGSTAPVSVSGTVGTDPQTVISGTVVADQGQLLNTWTVTPGFFGPDLGTQGKLCVGDVVFSGPAGTELTTVDIRITVSAFGVNDSLDARGNSVVDTGFVNITLNDIFLSSLSTTIDNTPTTETLTSALFTAVPLDNAVPLELNINQGANGVTESSTSAPWDTTFLVYLGGSPVFSFFDPDTGEELTGFTANSADALIANNFWTGTLLVPVPPAVWLFASALALLGWMRRKAA